MCQGLRKQTEPNINVVLAEVVSQSTSPVCSPGASRRPVVTVSPTQAATRWTWDVVPGPSACDVHPRQLFHDTRGLTALQYRKKKGLAVNDFGVAAYDALSRAHQRSKRVQHSGTCAVAVTVFCGPRPRDKTSLCLTG